MDKIKTKIAIYKTLLGITMGSAIYAGLNTKAYHDNVEHMAEVPSTLRYQLYYDEAIDSELPEFDPKSNRVDELVTYEVLGQLHHLQIDLSLVSDINYVTKCENVNSISIFCSEYLTKEDMKILANSTATKLIFYFDNPSLHREDGFDLNQFGDREIVVNFSPREELDSLVLINYLKNYLKDNVTVNLIGPHADVEKTFLMDAKLNEIIEGLNLNEKDTEYDKLLKIVKYVNEKIRYDADIAAYLDNNVGDALTSYQLSHYYNECDISSIILNDGNDIDGVCINYANLLDILCYKANIKSRTISGENDKTGHAWNVLYLNDKKSYVDLTAADSTYINKFIDQYFATEDKNEKTKISKTIDTILLMSLSTHKSFDLDKSVEELDTTPEVIDVMYNEGKDGEEVLHTKIPSGKYALIGYGSMLILLTSYELAKKLHAYLKARYEEEKEYSDEECVIYDFDQYKRLTKKGGK